ncbi:MAG: hypothetical protein IPP35_09635 [Elusimicrobia bacterium]|nr:hypothetical protein [Elusimicrobiota bacterium]
MKRQHVLVWAGLLMVSGSAARASVVEVAGGYSQVAAKWGDNLMGFNEHLSLDFDNTAFTRVEGTLCEKKLGLSAGVNVDLDNNEVGEVNRITGYLGLKKTYLRVQTGRLRGVASWDGALGTGQTDTVAFDNTFNHVDLLYWLQPKKMRTPLYFGLGYTSLKMPVEMQTMTTPGKKENQVLGTPVFDPDFQGRFYDLLFGFDTFASSMLYEDSMEAKMKVKGFGIFFATEDRAGLGQIRVGKDALAAASQLNGNRQPVDDKLFSGWIEYNVSMGLSWTGRLGQGRLSLGAGYEFMGATAVSFGGGASSPTEVGLDPRAELMRYGPVLRAYVRW